MTDTEDTITSGLVVRPGDTLIVWTERTLDASRAAYLRDRIRDRLPGLADVVVLQAAGVAAYRPEEMKAAPSDKSWIEMKGSAE